MHTPLYIVKINSVLSCCTICVCVVLSCYIDADKHIHLFVFFTYSDDMMYYLFRNHSRSYRIQTFLSSDIFHDSHIVRIHVMLFSVASTIVMLDFKLKQMMRRIK